MALNQGDSFSLSDLDKQQFIPTFDDSLKISLKPALELLDKYEYQGIFFVYTHIFDGKK